MLPPALGEAGAAAELVDHEHDLVVLEHDVPGPPDRERSAELVPLGERVHARRLGVRAARFTPRAAGDQGHPLRRARRDRDLRGDVFLRRTGHEKRAEGDEERAAHRS